MLQRVTLEGIELPRLYTASTRQDVQQAQEAGIPYIKWTRSHEELLQYLLRLTLEKMFPAIKWSRVLGPKRRFKTEVYFVDSDDAKTEEMPEQMSEEPAYPKPLTTAEPEEIELSVDEMAVADIANDTRIFNTEDDEIYPATIYKQADLRDYMGDVSSWVNLDVLQDLKLMPKFIGDILDCIKVNLVSGVHWSEGYNKKLGAALGNFNRSGQLPNLIILDISGSIPRGISATMLTLIDTLRTQVSADLIITAGESRFYPAGIDLPDPQALREAFGYSNESHMFFRILNDEVQGKHYGHVFSFGDWDTPDYSSFNDNYSLRGTQVEHVHHYHTVHTSKTGYAKWCHHLGKQPQEDYNTEWCKIIKE